MKKYLFLFFAIGGSIRSYSQDVEHIIALHIQALGGEQLLDSIRSLRYETLVHAMGADAPAV